jgi:hypothetical protein
MHAAESDCDSSEDGFCGCAVCESAILCAMVDEVSMSGQELMRWAIASLFAGRASVRCVR